jgi:putative PIN family toxin of toxin-antitoxin system
MQLAIDSDLELFTSPILVDELSGVLGRRHLTKKLLEQRTSVGQLCALYRQFTQSVSPLAVPRIVPNDPDDDHVLACALTACANLIVTGDRKHLLPLGSYEDIDIVTAAEALRRIEAPT